GIRVGVEGVLSRAVRPPYRGRGTPAEQGPCPFRGLRRDQRGGRNDDLGLALLAVASVLLSHMHADMGQAVDQESARALKSIGDPLVSDAEGAVQVEQS